MQGGRQRELVRLICDLDLNGTVNKGRMCVIQESCLVFSPNGNEVVKPTTNTHDRKVDEGGAFMAFVFPWINILDFAVINEKNGKRFRVLIFVHADYLSAGPARVPWVFRDDLGQK